MIKPRIIKSLNIFKDTRGSINIRKIPKDFSLKQMNITENKKFVIRGMHFQKNTQNKIIILLGGKILDVLINVHTMKKYYFKMSERYSTLFIPFNYAHGFQVLSSSAQLLYLFDDKFKVKNQIGFNVFDKRLNINWYNQKKIISSKDSNLEDFEKFSKKL